MVLNRLPESFQPFTVYVTQSNIANTYADPETKLQIYKKVSDDKDYAFHLHVQPKRSINKTGLMAPRSRHFTHHDLRSEEVQIAR